MGHAAAVSRMLCRISKSTAGYRIAASSRRREAASYERRSTKSDMTEPHKAPLSRTEQLENIVDQLDAKVAREREAEGVPGKPSDRKDAEVRGSEKEPPD